MDIKVIDAVMGTGKSTWAIQQLKETNKRTVVILPYRDEIKRYQDDLADLGNHLVALHEDLQTKNKQERFDDALEDTQVILITHALFTKFLKPHVFQIIDQGDWHLLMDEAIPAFEAIKGLSKTILNGWLVGDIVTEEPINDTLTRIVPVPGIAEAYIKADDYVCSRAEKGFLKQSLVHDLLRSNSKDGKGFFSFTLSEHRLKSFESVTVLTYMFRGSDLDYWCRMKDLKVDHQELTRDTEGLFHLQPHDGQYSGEQFRHMIEILDVKSKFGTMPGQLSSTSTRTKLSDDNVNEIQKDLRRLFRNRKIGPMIESEDFMFSCLGDYRTTWKGERLPKKFIGESTWVAFSTRGVNTLSHKHNLAFLYNIFPQPAVEHIVNSGLRGITTYSRDTYALSSMLQWIWRSAIRNGEAIRVYIPARRMRELLEGWLDAEGTGKYLKKWVPGAWNPCK